ncbi:MAG: beta-ketoacyl synthase [Kistimonas sp.]|nr:beta-ketoacyl synthase [Kistimonas sp.]
MSRLPLVVAQGGISSAGRTSSFNAYRRLVLDAMEPGVAQQTLASLASLTGLPVEDGQALLSGSLVRELDESVFSAEAKMVHRALSAQEGVDVLLARQQLPDPLPPGWQLTETRNPELVRVLLPSGQPFLVPETRGIPVRAFGQLPSGFQPEKLYPSRHHPRGLAMTVYGASDAISAMGLDWDRLARHVSPEQVSVYAGSSMSQLDQNGNGGLLQSRLRGRRVTTKQLPLGFAEMPADFINAYVLGSLGITGCSLGACASFLYNLRHAVDDIRSGRTRVAVVGASEAPVWPEVIEGYATMGALATDKALRHLDDLPEEEKPDYRRACRPFGNNCGFVLAESAQFFVLMDDSLALETGAEILGAVADVYVHADGYKKSISSPGAGNYITMARAAALGRNMLGDESLQNRSFVQAHGTGTHQNRVTESAILDATAAAFGIRHWPVAAVKSYMGHSLAAAGADQLLVTLGAWRHSVIPAIHSIERVAADVHCRHLNVLTEHFEFAEQAMDMAFLNAKGFGGNNATAVTLSSGAARAMLTRRHGQKALSQWAQRNEKVEVCQQEAEERKLSGKDQLRYKFGDAVLAAEDIVVTRKQVALGDRVVTLSGDNPFREFC